MSGNLLPTFFLLLISYSILHGQEDTDYCHYTPLSELSSKVTVYMTYEELVTNQSSKKISEFIGAECKPIKYFHDSKSIAFYRSKLEAGTPRVYNIYAITYNGKTYLNANWSNRSKEESKEIRHTSTGDEIIDSASFTYVEMIGPVMVLKSVYERRVPSCHHCPRHQTQMEETRSIVDAFTGDSQYFSLQGVERFLERDPAIFSQINSDFGIINKLNNQEDITNDLFAYLKQYNAKHRRTNH